VVVGSLSALLLVGVFFCVFGFSLICGLLRCWEVVLVVVVVVGD
jgi:hypothetical protein